MHTCMQAQAFILTWVHHYWCTPTAYLLTDQQTSPLFLHRSLLTGNPPLHLGGKGDPKRKYHRKKSSIWPVKPVDLSTVASLYYIRKTSNYHLLPLSWQRTIATPVKTLCSLPLKLEQKNKDRVGEFVNMTLSIYVLHKEIKNVGNPNLDSIL